MFNKSVATVQINITRVILAFALAVISFSSLATVASAQQSATGTTLSELQAQITVLMAQIAALSRGGVSEAVEPGVFAVGTAVQSTANVRVRALSDGTSAILGMVRPASIGVVQAGPIRQGNISWYRVSFKSGLAGWVAGNWLKKAGVAPRTTYPPEFVSGVTGEVKEIAPLTPLENLATPRFNRLVSPVGTGIAAVSAVFASPTTSSMGPVILGTINWGDGSALQNVSALPTGKQTVVNDLKHTYLKAGVYIITLTNLVDGKVLSEKVIVTLPEVSTTSTCTLAATPATIRAGQTVVLTWTTKNVKTVSINNGVGVVAVNGSKTVTPSKTTTYVLTSTSPVGMPASCSKTVLVQLSPNDTSPTATSTGIVRGAATVDQLAEIQLTLSNIRTILSELE